MKTISTVVTLCVSLLVNLAAAGKLPGFILIVCDGADLKNKLMGVMV
jgi:hypothetical protein